MGPGWSVDEKIWYGSLQINMTKALYSMELVQITSMISEWLKYKAEEKNS